MKAIVVLVVMCFALAAAAPKPGFLGAPLVTAPVAYATSYQYRSPYYAYPYAAISPYTPYSYGYASGFPYAAYPYSAYSYVI